MFFKNKKVIDKIYMGCGDDYKDGYVGCDIRKTKWQTSMKYIKYLRTIYFQIKSFI